MVATFSINKLDGFYRDTFDSILLIVPRDHDINNGDTKEKVWKTYFELKQRSLSPTEEQIIKVGNLFQRMRIE